MPTISLTSPTALTVITAGLHSTNYAALQSLLNGGLDNANIAAGAAIVLSKLAGYPADIAKIPRGDGTWVSGGMHLIGSMTAAGANFTSIPQTFRHLRLLGRTRTDPPNAVQNMGINFNGITTANYNYEILVATGGATTGAAGVAQTSGLIAQASQGNGQWSQMEIDIVDYTDPGKQITATSKFTCVDGTTIRCGVCGVLTNFSGPVTQVQVSPITWSTDANSEWWLYGIG